MANYFNVSIDYLLCNSEERLTVDNFIKKDSYELKEILSKYKITLSGTEISPDQTQRILDISTTLLLSDSI